MFAYAVEVPKVFKAPMPLHFTYSKKLMKRKVPAGGVRVLMLVPEEQQAWVRCWKARSRSFGILNGTRQGSVLSPALFSVYMDDLIV